MRILYRMKDTFRSVKWFLKNIHRFRTTLWVSRPWDYYGLLQAMQDQLDSQISYGMPHIMNGERYLGQMKVARELIRRIKEENYLDDKIAIRGGKFIPIEGSELLGFEVISEKLNDLPTKKLAYKTNYRKQDLDMLTNILNKHMLHWWD